MSKPRHTFLPMVNGVRASSPVPCTPIKQFMGVEGFCFYRAQIRCYRQSPMRAGKRKREVYKKGWLIAHRALGIAARYDVYCPSQQFALRVAEEYVRKHVREGETPQQTIERMIGTTAVRQAMRVFRQSAQSPAALLDWSMGLGEQGETAL